MSTRNMCYIAVFASFIAVSAQISIPLPYGVPLTLQTLAIAFGGIMLGPQKGAMAVLIYILLGIVGVPVFAGLRGGIAVIVGPTGGFILSFPFIALIAGLSTALSEKRRKWLFPAGLILGAVINYLFGMLWFRYVMEIELQAAFTVAVLPFIPGTIMEIMLLSLTKPQKKRYVLNKF